MLLYFIPTTEPTIKRPALKALGLAHAMEEGDPPVRTCNGPGGVPGLVFLNGGRKSARFDAKVQEWVQAPGGKFWIGRLKSGPAPTPDDLMRPNAAGNSIRLADGNDWMVPVCFSVVGSDHLPRAMTLDFSTSKNWILSELPELAPLHALARRAWKAWLFTLDKTAEREEMSWNDAVQLVTLALARNYRIGPTELSVLGLLTTEAVTAAVKLIIDWPAVREALAKVPAAEPAAAPEAGADAAGGDAGAGNDAADVAAMET